MAKGKLFARLAYANGRTRLVEHRQSAPLKIARTFEREDGGLDICVMDASPGLLAGDRYEMEWILEPGAKLRVTTQGATRIHPSGGPISAQNVSAQVAREARFEWWPESTIPFRDARFHSNIDIRLAQDAEAVIFESLSAGRVARGERFDFHEVSLRLHVHDERGPRLFTRNRFFPVEAPLNAPFSWGEALQWSSLFAFGSGLPSPQEINSFLEAASITGSASTLAKGDLAVAFLGRRAHDLRCLALEIERILTSPVSRETL